jgi:D-alanyl-D-alanine dipeptidase
MGYYSDSIPMHKEQKGWQHVEILESDQRLIPVSQLDMSNIVELPMYYDWGLPGALNHCYLREEVATKLVKAASNLPSGYKYLIWDGYRPFDVQKALFDQYFTNLKKKHPDYDESMLYEMTKKYVSYPSINQLSPAPHITGGAVDLTIVDDDGKPLYMGTDFDAFTSESSTTYYEQNLLEGVKLQPKELEALENRRLLYHTLTEAGFTNYPDEWWHFDYGNQWWAIRKTKPHAIYGVASPHE